MNCKPGDLAIVVHAYIPEELGRFVEVIMGTPNSGWIAPDGSYFLSSEDGLPRWYVHSLGSPFVCVNEVGMPSGLRSFFDVFKDSSLRPIRPDADPLAEPRTTDLPKPEPVAA